MLATCPSHEVLVRLVEGLLSDDDLAEIAEHVAQCEPCQSHLSQLDADDTVGIALRKASATQRDDSPTLKALLSALAKIVPQPERATDSGQEDTTPPRNSTGSFALEQSAVTQVASSAALATAAEFLTTLQASGIVLAADWDGFVAALPEEARASGTAQDLARLLIKQQKLTRFQAAVLYQGRSKGLVWGEYVVLDKIGKGGMGQVLLARHRRMDRQVALKLLPAAATKSKESVQRFEREVKAAARLNHPHIVTAYDAGEQDGRFYLAMEYVAGQDLSQQLRQQGALSLVEAVNLTLQAAKGLSYAHAKGIVHRDIKPANMLVDADGTLKILDMGLARLTGDQDEAEGLTQSGAAMGTADYMAPEQARNTRHADARSDIYSLGCTLYRLLTGEAPFAGETFVEKILAHQGESFPKLQDKHQNVPAELETLLQKMVAKSPDDRYQTMDEVAAALELLVPQLAMSGTLATSGKLATSNSPQGQGGSQPRRRTAAAKGAGKGRHRRPVLLACSVLGAALLAGVILLSLRTPHGQVVVELAEGIPAEAARNIKIEVSGGGDVKVADATSGWSIDIAEGKYQAKLAGGGDRFELEQNQVTVSRGAKTLLTVSLKPAGEAPATAAIPRPSPVPAATPATTAKPATPAKPWQPTPEQQAFFDEVAKLPVEEQVEAVGKKLHDINPGFDGEIYPKVEFGRVSTLSFQSDGMKNIWPVRALAELSSLDCRASKGTLTDITPLMGMPLTSLNLTGLPISDLSPLQGMLLTSLDIRHTRVSDLSPIKGMPLKKLQPGITRISNLAPLVGMELTELNIGSTLVTDLSPLAGMQLTNLYLGSTRVTDLSPLADMPLAELNCASTSVTDLSPLAQTPIWNLNISGSPISDLSPLSKMNLKWLNISSTPVSSLASLRGLQLEQLRLSDTGVSDISAIRGMPLKVLQFRRTKVAEISPIKDMPLAQLTLSLSLFHNNDENTVKRATTITDLAIANNNPIVPPSVAWETFNTRRASVLEFAQTTRELPVADQVATIAAKLRELAPKGQDAGLEVEPRDGAIQVATISLTPEVDDITPLRALVDLRQLTIVGGPHWLDLSPINIAPLEELTCSEDIVIRNRLVLGDIATLKTINGQPAAEYLKSLRPSEVPAIE